MQKFLRRAKSWIGRHPALSLGMGAFGLVVVAVVCLQLALRTAFDNIGSTLPPDAPAPPPAEPAPQPAEPVSPPVVDAPVAREPAPVRPPTPARPPAVGTELDRALDRLERGSLAFNAPERMKVTEQFGARALLRPGNDVEALRRALATAEGRIETGRDVRIANVMGARLSGPGFRIDPAEVVDQPISAVEPTEWQWSITAMTPGRQSLTLALFAKVVVEGRERARLIKTFERTVEVSVAPKTGLERLNDALEPWQKLLGAVVAFVSAAFGLYTWWRKRREKAPTDDS